MCVESQSRVYRRYPEFDAGENAMQFRLTYEGTLRSSSNNNRNTDNKHQIRKAFHGQLRKLWETEPNLKALAEMPRHLLGSPLAHIWRAQGNKIPYLQHIANDRPLKDYRFVPLVTDDLSLWCGLDILYLRHGVAGRIFDAGDIDNRIKTLFDALKRPTQLQELGPTYIPPAAHENPFYVLLDDDKYIGKLAVETDTMLEQLIGGIPNDNDARLIITVTLRPTVVTPINIPFAG